MRNAKWGAGDFGASTRPISFAPKIKANKERLLKKFREDLGRKGYSPAEASQIAEKVRTEANGLALEANARQGNDDRVRMANIHTMALKMMIKKTLKTIPSKSKAMSGEYLGRISKNSPMTALADRAKAYDTHIIKRRAERRDNKRERAVAQRDAYRERRGKLKDGILNEVKRASYMTQFNGLGYYGALGHYHGTMGLKFKKPKFIAKIQKSASSAGKDIAKAAKKIAADPRAFAAKVMVAPVSLIASVAPKHTVLGKAARKVESGAIKVVKTATDFVGKILKFIWDKIIKGAWELIKKAFKGLFDWFKDLLDWLKQKVWDKFHGKSGVSGMGELGADEKAAEMKHLERSVLSTANRLKAKGEGDFTTGLQTFALKDVLEGTGAKAGQKAVGAQLGPTTLKIIASGGQAAVTEGAKAVGVYFKASVPVTAGATMKASADIGNKVVGNLKDIAFDEACKDYGNDIASRKIKNPILKSVTTQAINGDLSGKMENVRAVATGITDPAKREEFIRKAEGLTEEKRIELIKQAAIPSNFKPMVANLDKQTKQIASKVDVTKDTAQSVADFANNLGSKDAQPLPQQAIAAIKAEGAMVRDNVAIAQANKGEISKTEALAAMSPIGRNAVLEKLPQDQRKVVMAEIKSEQPAVFNQALENKEKANTGALLTAAAIAAKVLLF
jgi:hypothetical protein